MKYLLVLLSLFFVSGVMGQVTHSIKVEGTFYHFQIDSLGYEIMLDYDDVKLLRLPNTGYDQQIQILTKDTAKAIKYLSHLYYYERQRCKELGQIIDDRNEQIKDYEDRMARIRANNQQLKNVEEILKRRRDK